MQVESVSKTIIWLLSYGFILIIFLLSVQDDIDWLFWWKDAVNIKMEFMATFNQEVNGTWMRTVLSSEVSGSGPYTNPPLSSSTSVTSGWSLNLSESHFLITHFMFPHGWINSIKNILGIGCCSSITYKGNTPQAGSNQCQVAIPWLGL